MRIVLRLVKHWRPKYAAGLTHTGFSPMRDEALMGAAFGRSRGADRSWHDGYLTELQ
jgi:hypothetical protein